MLVKVVKTFSEGDRERAEDIFDAYLPLIRYEQQPNFGCGGAEGSIATSRRDKKCQSAGSGTTIVINRS